MDGGDINFEQVSYTSTYQRPLRIFLLLLHECFSQRPFYKHSFLTVHFLFTKKTTPSVNYAKDWLLDQLFLFPGLVWKRVSTIYIAIRWQATAFFLCIGTFSAWWTNKQLCDPSASLLDQWKSTLLQFTNPIVFRQRESWGLVCRFVWLAQKIEAKFLSCWMPQKNSRGILTKGCYFAICKF